MVNLDKGTYGNSPAAHKLVEVINEHQLDCHDKIGKFLSHFNQCLHEMKKINTSISVGIVHVLFEDALKKADKFPSTVRTFIRNLIVARYRRWMEENNAQKPKKNRVKIAFDLETAGLFNGGLQKGVLNVIVGEKGTGKSSFLSRKLNQLMLERSIEAGVSLDEIRKHIAENGIKFPTVKHELIGSVVFPVTYFDNGLVIVDYIDKFKP